MDCSRSVLALLLIVAACGDARAPDAGAAVVWDSAGVIFVRNVAPPPDTLTLRAPTVRIGSAGLGGAPEYAFQYVSDMAVLPGGKVLVVDNDELLWTPGTEPRIEVRDADGTLVRVITLPRAAGPVRAADCAAYFRTLRERFGLGEAAMARERRATEFVRKRLAITNLLVDDRGRIWAAAFDPTRRARNYAGSEWTALSRTGHALRHVRFPQGFSLMRIRNGRAYGLTKTELGARVIDVFALRPMNTKRSS